jgi:hypothetical protein
MTSSLLDATAVCRALMAAPGPRRFADVSHTQPSAQTMRPEPDRFSTLAALTSTARGARAGQDLSKYVWTDPHLGFMHAPQTGP